MTNEGRSKMADKSQPRIRSIVTQVVPIWFEAAKEVPQCDLTPESFGIPVLVAPAPNLCSVDLAYYGCRITKEPNFYLHGVVIHPTHWMPVPVAPPGPSKNPLFSNACPFCNSGSTHVALQMDGLSFAVECGRCKAQGPAAAMASVAVELWDTLRLGVLVRKKD